MPTEFTFFGAEHFFWLGFAAVSSIVLIVVAKRQKKDKQERIALWIAWFNPIVWIVISLLLAPVEDWNSQLPSWH